MRRIKFRAWANNRFHYWGFIDRAFVGVPQTNEPLSMKEIEKRSQQYTGLKDKNGVEIYEGDIVRINDEPDENCSSIDDITNIGWLKGFIGRDRPVEVIGNIYENPELLEDK